MRLTFLFATLLISHGVFAQTIVVKPYLQNAETTSMHIMWETSSDNSTSVEYGLTSSLGTTVSGTSITGNGASQLHDVELSGLTPATIYYYRAITGSVESDIFFFRTQPLQSAEESFNIVAMSDMQQDWTHPDVFNDIVDDNLIPYIEEKFGNDLATDLAYFFIPGDLVTTGSNYGSWASTFFEPAENLLSYVPLYPVPGNHEANTPTFFKYFNLPLNGSVTNDYPEHWWYKDHSNVRLIGLESNNGYRVQVQLDWLDTVLTDACADPDIDFVFAQIHHPYESELWIAGNTGYVGDVITLLEDFSTNCGKPSAHFFGHTHGYSRGQSKEHNHTMVNVATAGGAIDNWGEFAQQDYPEFSRSDDDFGFVLMEVEAGSDPKFKLTRLSHGSYEDGLVTNVLKDSLEIKFNNPSPNQPTGIFPEANDMLSPDCIIFLGSDFTDSEGDLQGATQWQIATDAAFTSLVYDEWYQFENWYFDVDELAGNNMVDQEVSTLQENTSYYWRVRYRDRSLAWSDWSDEITFQTTTTTLTANLITNGGAENGITDWVQDQGSFESINSGECAGNNAHAGSKLFAVGGVCTGNAYGEGHQDVDVSSFQTQIEAGGVLVNYGGYLSDYNGSDVPEFKVQFFDGALNMISESPTTSHTGATWTVYNQSMAIPANTQTIRLVLMGTRNAGIDNDSYFDDVFVRLNLNPAGCEEYQDPLSIAVTENPTGVSVYPNPFSVRTNIEVNGAVGHSSYQLIVMDRTGRTVITETSSNGKFVVSGSELATGFYLYDISTEGWTGKGKLVVE